MSNRTIDPSHRIAARIAGFGYLIIIVAGVLAEFVVRSSLIVSGDAAATASNILGSESLFRLSIAGDLVMIGADLIVAVALYALLSPINRSIALLAALGRVVMDAILGVNLLNLVAVLRLLDGDTELPVFGVAQSQGLVMAFLDAHAIGYSIALVPFGLATILIGYLLFTSHYVPRLISIMVVLASLVYLTGSFVHIMAPSIEETFSLAYVIPFIAELALALWLSFKGVQMQSTNRKRVPAMAS